MDGRGVRAGADARRGDRPRRPPPRACGADTGRGHRRDPLPGARHRGRTGRARPQDGAAGRGRAPADRLRAPGGGGRRGGPDRADSCPSGSAISPRNRSRARRPDPPPTSSYWGCCWRTRRPGRPRSPTDRRRRPPNGSPARNRNWARYRTNCAADRALSGQGPGRPADRGHGGGGTGAGGRGGPRQGRLAAGAAVRAAHGTGTGT